MRCDTDKITVGRRRCVVSRNRVGVPLNQTRLVTHYDTDEITAEWTLVDLFVRSGYLSLNRIVSRTKTRTVC